MNKHISQTKSKGKQNRRRQERRRQNRRRKSRIQLFLNSFMFICIVVVVVCIGMIQNRDRYAEIDRNIFTDGIDESRAGITKAGVGEAEATDGKGEIGGSEDTEDTWKLTLVNKWNPLPDNINIETVELSNGEFVDSRIYPYLQEMFDAARMEGIYPIVRSGYRTRQEQEDIYYDRIRGYQSDGMSEEEARRETEQWVAIPGTSEHELGLAVDINADKTRSEGTEVYAWLKDHAHLYGFINRYPWNKTEITGVANEPWHYRYVGVEAASEIYEKGICLEEYLGRIDG